MNDVDKIKEWLREKIILHQRYTPLSHQYRPGYLDALLDIHDQINRMFRSKQ
jgi:hypothetical protein